LVAGWTTTEVGRQPWVVYGVMRTGQAVTGAHSIPVGYGVLAAAYAILIAGVVWALRRLAKAPMPSADPGPPGPPPVGGRPATPAGSA
jgi:cytochrome d ubiquinol oxidase subunit I